MLDDVNYSKRQIKEKYGLTLEGHFNEILAVAITNDCKYVVSADSSGKIIVWNLIKKIIEFLLGDQQFIINSVSFSHNNAYIGSGGEENAVRIWNFENRCQESILKGHTDRVWSIAFAQNNKKLKQQEESK